MTESRARDRREGTYDEYVVEWMSGLDSILGDTRKVTSPLKVPDSSLPPWRC